jgi:predicted peptidase
MPYRLFVPRAYDKTRRYPLVVWLHGASGRGQDNLRQIFGDQFFGSRLWIAPENQAKHPAFVVAPQSEWGWAFRQDALHPDLSMVAGILDTLLAEFAIDAQRVYVMGQSMGGGAAWGLVTNQPERFAAAVLVCPAIGDSTASPRAAHVPLWAFQGDKDEEMVKTVELIDTIKKNGGQPRFTVFRGEGHDIWMRAFADPELIEWLFAQAR